MYVQISAKTYIVYVQISAFYRVVFLTGSALKVLSLGDCKIPTKKGKFDLKLPIFSVRYLYFHFFGRAIAIFNTKNF